MGKANEGGSVLSFVIIGAILVLLLIGGTYFVRQKLFVSANNKGQAPDTSQPQPSSQPDTSKKPAKKDEPAKTPDTSSPTQPSNSGQDTAGAPSTTLPQTGPVQTLSVALGIAFLTATFTAYLRSRRDYASL
jgi:predicted lipid-binding transport protein (Tim44 family)